VSLLEALALSTLVSLAFDFGVGRDFLAFLGSGSVSEPSCSLAVVSAFLRLLDFAPAPDSGRVLRFFEGDGVLSPATPDWALQI
jgi:hypothetical protein